MMLSCLLCLIYFNIPYSFLEKVVRLTLSNLPIKKCKSYVNLFFPRKMLVGKAMYIKVTFTNLELCYTLSGPMACCPFSNCKLLLMLQVLQVKKPAWPTHSTISLQDLLLISRIFVGWTSWFYPPADFHFLIVRSLIDHDLYSRQVKYAFSFHNSDELLV